ncbi:MAG TPA: phosphoenolpyruvate--protein phosphotransferase [Alphaproteobacteria bacterium]|nr:phosphoenolpyruvate--protein phosphotransferase [Alphaproteobacteria bacterium]
MRGAQGGSAPGISPSRRLLARLRDVMAGSGTVQSRLDKIVQLIAAEMVAEVCSCYVMRPGDVLELFATIGLNPEAVHRTRLRVGEGLVGEIALTSRPLAIANAPSHPNFVYRPETGEDPYQSLVGVPILRGGKVRGVLVIQNARRRNYSEEEVETLQTIAMVVAELVAGRDLSQPDQTSTGGTGGILPTRIDGLTLNPGLAQGLAVLHQPQLTIRQMVADDPKEELTRFRKAVDTMHATLDQLLETTLESGAEESRDILETYRMFARDRGWLGRISEAINAGLTAEAAVQRVQNDMRARMAHLTDPYIRERLYDFDDLANRLLLHLAGRISAAASGTLPDDIVLIARSIGPAELLDYDQRRLRALVLEDGSATSHVAIVAKALDIPVVGRMTDVLSVVEPLDPVIVDGDNGQIFVRPAEDLQELFQQTVQLRAQRRQEYAGLAKLPAESRDGVRVALHINAGLLIDMPHLETTGADGVGLYRTEIPFMVRAAFPEVETQTELYAKILDHADGKPVLFRTLDVGGDKKLPYFETQDQENPALGWRAIRIGLDRPAMLRGQIRALIRASQGRPVSVMFPMISCVSELDGARRILELELERGRREGRTLPASLRVGVMVEVPSLLWQLPQLLPRVDFLSVGSNDLMQYLFAADRGNPKLARRYDVLSPPMLNVLKAIVDQCNAAGVPLGLCGEMAGRPLEAMALVGIGFRSLSMAPAALGAIKTMIRSLEVAPLAEYLDAACRAADHSLREKLRLYAKDHGVPV